MVVSVIAANLSLAFVFIELPVIVSPTAKDPSIVELFPLPVVLVMVLVLGKVRLVINVGVVMVGLVENTILVVAVPVVPVADVR